MFFGGCCNATITFKHTNLPVSTEGRAHCYQVVMDTANRRSSTLVFRCWDNRLHGWTDTAWSSCKHSLRTNDRTVIPNEAADASPSSPRCALLLSEMGVDRLKERGCGLAGAGRSPNRKPGRNWAPEVGLGEVGEPRLIGSVPTETDNILCSG